MDAGKDTYDQTMEESVEDGKIMQLCIELENHYPIPLTAMK